MFYIIRVVTAYAVSAEELCAKVGRVKEGVNY
jgi:hypothetical protein